MGTFTVPVEIGDAGGTQFRRLEAMVDTGSTYLVVPRDVLEELGCRPVEQRRFSLGDERIAEYDIGVVALRLGDRTFPMVCVFGDPDSEALLGAVALEIFMLAVDPVNQVLVPVVGMLK